MALIMIIAWAPWRKRLPAGQPAVLRGSAVTGSAVAGSAATGSAEPVSSDAAAATQPAGAAAASGHQYGIPEQTGPVIWGIQAPIAIIGLVLAAFAGLWVGGYPAALVVPAGTALFLAAAESGTESWLSRLLASPWLAAGLLAAASVCVALGSRLTGGPSTLLSGSLPQVLCFGVVARLIAALLGEFRAADRTAAAQAGEAAPARGSGGPAEATRSVG